MSESKRYLGISQQLRRNPGQWAAYESRGHCVVLAGPGSGKTKTLTLKLARMLAEDVNEPRGIACITYSNECARELEHRLDSLAVNRNRVFVGTVHSFALSQVILPYASVADIGVPADFSIATSAEQQAALQDAFQRIINRADNPQTWRDRMNAYRRYYLDRGGQAFQRNDPELAALVEAYEGELRRRGRIDFDDMPLVALRALRDHPWIQEALKAKYPVLFVDEYQDLGRALHLMVMGLCFRTGIRLFAVGDVDQSIYGFTGASPELLRQLSQRPDVEPVQLRLNYRSGARIVTASQYALGEDRDYEVPDGVDDGIIFFHAGDGTLEEQADHLFRIVLPEAFDRVPDLRPADVAVLYQAAWIGDIVADAARQHANEVVRADRNSIYPRNSNLMRWLELCARWCCGGWQEASPSFNEVALLGTKIYFEALSGSDQRLLFRREIISFLWRNRTPEMSLRDWIASFRVAVIEPYSRGCRALVDEIATLNRFESRLAIGADLNGFTLAQFAGQGPGNDRITLTTLHSSKGLEFSVVVLFGIDNGRVPRRGAAGAVLAEARRSFYVGFTRAKHELHLMYSRANPSPFIQEVEERLAEYDTD